MELLFAPLDMELVLGVQLAANNTLLFLMLLLFSLASLSNELAELLTGTLGGRGAGISKNVTDAGSQLTF